MAASHLRGEFVPAVAAPAAAPDVGHRRLHALRGAPLQQPVQLFLGVRGELVDRHHRGDAELLHVPDVPPEVGDAGGQGLHVRFLQLVLGDAAVHLQRADRRHHHDGRRRDVGHPGLDVHVLLGPQVRAEAGLGDHNVREPAGRLGGDQGIAAVRDVGERPAVHQRGRAGDGLHEVGLDGVPEQQGQGSLDAEVGHGDGLAVVGVAERDPAQPFAEVGQVRGEAEHGHDLGRHGDVEAVLPRDALAGPPRPITTSRRDRSFMSSTRLKVIRRGIDVQLVALEDVVVHEGHQGVVRRGDGVEVAGEMQVDLVHGQHLGVAAAGGAALHAQDRAQRGLAQRDHDLVPGPGQRIRQPHRGGGLSLPGRRGRHRGDEHHLAGGAAARRPLP